jgi:hypothetical protein
MAKLRVLFFHPTFKSSDTISTKLSVRARSLSTATSSSTSLLAICSQHCYAPICPYSIGRLESKNNPPIDIEERKDANNQHDAESNVSDNEEMDELQREASAIVRADGQGSSWKLPQWADCAEEIKRACG